MAKPKNKVVITIESCHNCPNATLKFLAEEKEDYMYCQTERSCIQLRRRWGIHPIPSWCPRLRRKQNLCGKRAEIPGILS
jgi:hypothetical protein